jgi:hypothetical protein
MSSHDDRNLRDLLPCSFDVANFGLYSQFTLRSHFSGYTSDLCSEDRQLVNHIIDSIDQIQNLSRYLDTDNFLSQITTSDSSLDDQLDAGNQRPILAHRSMSDRSHLFSQVGSHDIDTIGQVLHISFVSLLYSFPHLPCTSNTRYHSLTTKSTICSDLSGYSSDLGRETS